MENNGGYVFSSFTAIFILVILIFIISALTNANKYKHDWEKNKCKPGVIPIAGYIKNEPGMTPSEFTKKNYKECYSKISKEVADEASVAYKDTLGAAESTFNSYGNTLTSFESKLTNIKNIVGNTFSYIISSIINMLMPVFNNLFTLKSLINKINALFHTIAYYSFTVIYSFRAFFGSFLELIIAFLVIMAAAIAVMWIIPFGFIPATAATIMFAAISVPLGLVAVGLKDLNIKHSNIPKTKRQGCFSGDTLINNIPIRKLNIGDNVGENNHITALFKYSSCDLDVYMLDNITVTSHHKVRYNNKWIHVQDHSRAVKIQFTEPYVYCINTSQKVFKINEHEFLDWDEIDTLAKENIISKNGSFDRYLIGGFNYDNSVLMDDGTYKIINSIQVNDVLYNNNKVLGVVIIEPLEMYKYSVNNIIYKASNNVYVTDEKIKNDKLNKIKITSNIAYHLITDDRTFIINDIVFHDYDYALEKYL
jgi:hypothetical protein